MYERSAELYDAIYAFKDYAREAASVHEVIERTRRSAGRSLLDVACGTGLHAAAFRTWYEVEGVELSDGMLAVARGRLPASTVHRGDMRDFALARRFDAVTCLFSSIGYVRTVDGMRRAVRNMARHLAPGGVLVVEPWFFPDAYRPGHLSAQFVDGAELKVARFALSELVDRVSVLDMHHLVGSASGIESFVERHELGLFTLAEYLDAHARAGLDAHFEEAGPAGRGLFVAKAPEAAEWHVPAIDEAP